MHATALKFPNLHKLWEFRIEIDARIFNVNAKAKTLSCNCSDNHINLALRYYNAKLINTQPTN